MVTKLQITGFTKLGLFWLLWTCLAFCDLACAWALSECGCIDVSYFCCGNRCCDQEEFKKFHEDDDDTLFIKTGLKSALVLLIMSSAIFLGCFCIMRCCKKGVTRSSRPHCQVSLAEYRMSQAQRSHRVRSHNATRLPSSSQMPSSAAEIDEPPSYSEVVGNCSRYDEEISETLVEEKPPPEYSSVVKQDDLL